MNFEAPVYKSFDELPKYVKRLAEMGYCTTSRRYGLISRVDREDWREFMANNHAPWDIGEGYQWIDGLGEKSAADHYRRVYSKDILTLHQRFLKYFPKSSDSEVGYVKIRGYNKWKKRNQ